MRQTHDEPAPARRPLDPGSWSISQKPEPAERPRPAKEAIAGVLRQWREGLGGSRVPVIVDDVKNHVGFAMTRCSYLSIECDEPKLGWSIDLPTATLPFVMLGLAGIVIGPPTGRDLFEEPSDFDALFESVEANDLLYVDLNDVWLPNDCFGSERPARGDIYRVDPTFFAEAFAFRESPNNTERFAATAGERREQIAASPRESAAFREWSAGQIENARQAFVAGGANVLAWSPDPRYPEEGEEA